ncbi:MAG: GAF domain-containing protein [Cyanophyceae cyanobacterium]
MVDTAPTQSTTPQFLSEQPLEALQQTLQRMREQEDPKPLIELSLQFVGHVFVAPLIWLGIYDYNTHQIVGQGGVTLLEDDSFLHSVISLQPGGILEQVVIEQRPVSLPDMSQETRMGIWQQQAQPMGGIQGCIIYPIRYERRCVGVLMLGSQVWGVTITDEEKALIGILLEHLAASLQQLENKWQEQTEQHLEGPLLQMLQMMRDASSLTERIEIATQALQEFLSLRRIQVYLFEPQQSRFVLWGSPIDDLVSKTSLTHKSGAKPASMQVLGVRELGDMYALFQDGQIVATTEAMGTTRSEVPPKLMQQLKAQALLAAPLLVEGELQGMIWAISDGARLWEDVDRQMIGSAATLLGFGVPIAILDDKINQIQTKQSLVQDLADSLHNASDLKQRISLHLRTIVEQMQIAGIAILLSEPEGFSVYLEHWQISKTAFPPAFRALTHQDWEDLSRDDALVAENYQQDLRLLCWQRELEPLEIRSLMLAHTDEAATPPVEGLVLVVHQQVRAWTRPERRLVRALAQQLGVVLKMARLERTAQLQEKLWQGSMAALLPLQSLQTVPEVISATLSAATHALEVPLAVIVQWDPGSSEGSVFFYSRDPQAKLTGTTQVDARRDPLIVQCVQAATGLLNLKEADLVATTRTWLTSSSPLTRLLVTPLGYLGEGIPPLGILIVTKPEDSEWEHSHQETLILLAQTCCWTLRRILWVQGLQRKLTDLQELNWYKHRRLGDLQTNLMDQLRRLGQVPEIPGTESTRWQKVVEIARTLKETGTSSQSLLRSELWTPQPESGILPVATLIRRTLQRLEPIIQKRKLWPQVHGETKFALSGDPGRIEMVLYEVMLVATARSPMDSRLDLWVEQQEGYADLILQDTGSLPEPLLAALQQDPSAELTSLDPLAPKLLNTSPGLELSLCQRVIGAMGGQLDFYLSEEGHPVTRLVLAIAPH